MANLMDSVENSIWHAFDYLALDGHGTVPKDKLKTLTSRIGKEIGLEDVDKGIDDFRSTNSLSFDQYRFYLFKEVFSALPDELSVEDQHKYESQIDDVCWQLCSINYLERDNPIFPDESVYQLFRIFCMLGDMVEDDEGKIEVIMAAAEVESAVYQFMINLGRGSDWDPEEFDSVASVISAFKFGVFVTVLESKYAKDIDEGGLREAVRDVHDFYLLDVVKKGMLGKKMELFPAFREHFFVLQPNKLSFYNSASQKEKRGEIKIDAQCRAEPIPDSSSRSPIKTPGSKSHSKLNLFANEKTFDFQAQDHRTRSQWLNAFKVAIEHSGQNQRYQRTLLEKRRVARAEEKEREEEEMLKTSELDAQLQTEKEARAFAEQKAETLARQTALDANKMRELERIREQLEMLLEEERQAKKDEEIVRTLQARILNEEWARRETLERLQEEQKQMLESERKKREEFEKIQQDKERQLKEAQMRVEEMEKERMKLDRQLNLAQEKTRKANIGQEILEAKIKVKEHESLLEKDATLSRSSLNPSASFYVRNRADRPSYMPMRSASMRETSYSRSIRRNRNRNNNNNVLGDSLSVTNEVNPANSAKGSRQNLTIEENTVAE